MFQKLKPTAEQVDLEIFTIYDSKSKSYDVPTFARNADVLKRDILNMFRDPQQAANKFLVNAEDYSVYKIATYCKKTGVIEAQNLEHIVNLHDLRALLPERPVARLNGQGEAGTPNPLI